MIKLNCIEEMCPIPIIKLKAELEKGTPQFIIVTDHNCTVTAVEDYLTILKLYYIIEEVISGIWEITVFNEK